MEKKLILLVLILCMIPNMAQASTYMVVDQPDLRGSVFNSGAIASLVAQGSTVYLNKEGARTEIISDLSGQISALAMGDLTGDLKDDVVIATANAGAIYIYQEQNEKWQRVGEPLYTWTTIAKLEVHDFNNDGWGDVVILTAQGEAQIFLSWEGRLLPFWKSSADQVVVDWAVVDLNQDGYVDLVYILQSGYIGALTWNEQEFSTLWENYPWGQMESLVVLEQTNRPELIGVTSQKMLYGWRWNGTEVVSTRHFHAAELGEKLFYIPEQGLLSFSQKTGASLFELKTGGVVEKWRVPRVSATKAFYANDQYLLGDKNLNYFSLVPSDGLWRIFAEQVEITDLVEIHEYEGKLYYNVADLATALDFTVIKGRYWHLLKDGQYLTIDQSNFQIKTAGLTIPFNGSFHLWEDQIYCSSEFLPLMGWLVELDQARQYIQLYPNWGWWLVKDK